jgi:secreted Zn-dependent insulinase-like peptidase
MSSRHGKDYGVLYLRSTELFDRDRLFGELIRDSLTEITYDASLAGLDYDVDNGSDGLTVSLSGYNDKLPVLLKVVLERIRSYKVNPERLQVFKEQVRPSNHHYTAIVNTTHSQPIL